MKLSSLLTAAGFALCVALGLAARGGELAQPLAVSAGSTVRGPAAQPPVGLPGDKHLDKTPPRKTVGLDLVRNGWTYNCMECHKLIPARWHYAGSPTSSPAATPVSSGSGTFRFAGEKVLGVLNEHKDIHLDHGNNRFCLNCHHPTNRNAFVDYDGSEIPQADVVQLCAKCHGTIYRDWKAGVHGRQNGFWKVSLGERRKLRCIQCHDPHSPKFKAMPPLPPLRYPPRGANPPSTSETRTPRTTDRA